ncbi:Gfo/Idh/MocA family protein [Amycolatopsis alkalitolerans]|uniref:Gfo/Idh/MocA family oxidoreductase n=1 Tax=Amycolatopsis alkalitolerans TaxID=2547244 RepID=A0A5C4M718_9PSEU|nr:Gfo/Idh/MocA family oxidoreductase [Amycolatopsis alkalitolerans]TNC27424.1 Gfo/Idh/MocA family oxidoreductase [Amycolatopsis alkalitolerans]
MRLALVGTGCMGRLHARTIAGSRASLVRVIEPRADAGRACAAEFGAAWAPSLDTLSDVDAVVLASATESHHELALEILKQGKPLLVEKPVADELGAAEEIVRLSENLGVPVMCGFVERFNPAVVTAMSLVTEPVHLIAHRHGPYAPRIRTGVAWDLLVHDVDLAIRCFGCSPVRVTSAAGYFHPASAPAAEDTVDATLSFPTGVATLSASRLGQRKTRTITMSELDRVIEVDLVARSIVVTRGSAVEVHEPTGPEPLAAQLEYFLALAAGQVDADAERASILPAHQVIAQATNPHPS